MNKHGLLDRLLCLYYNKPSKRFDIWKRNDNGEEELYLRRFFLYRSKKGNVYLHHILREDTDSHVHNHPWKKFWIFILWGKYTEDTPDYGWGLIWKPGMSLFKTVWKMFSFREKNGEDFHKIAKEGFKETWSLVITEPATRIWEFWDDDGIVDYKTYLNKYFPGEYIGSHKEFSHDPDSL